MFNHHERRRYALLKFIFIHSNGDFRFALPQEMGITGWQVDMATLAFVEAQRTRFRQGLHYLYLPLYDQLCAFMCANPNGMYWAPYSGLRSFEEQLAIYQRGRTPESVARKEPIVSWAQPGDSAHNWGCATDWAEFRPDFKGSDAWNKADWDFYHAACRSSNLDWGGDWDRDGLSEPRETDYPHNQVALSVAWKKIGDLYRSRGEVAAMEEIKAQALTNEEGLRI